MKHVFVETNWVFGFAAPAHHKKSAAVELLARARRGEFRLHLPSLCLTEVRNPLRSKCQPRYEANAIRDFLELRGNSSQLTAEGLDAIHSVLNRFESSVDSELALLPLILSMLRTEPSIDVFALSDPMLSMAVDLTLIDLALQPFDQCVLAAVLVRARELWDAGERELCFCELDKDLQPWDRPRNRKPLLADLYDQARAWVYGNFELTLPVRPSAWPASQPTT